MVAVVFRFMASLTLLSQQNDESNQNPKEVSKYY